MHYFFGKRSTVLRTKMFECLPRKVGRGGNFSKSGRIAQARKAITSLWSKQMTCVRPQSSKALKRVGTLFDNGWLVTFLIYKLTTWTLFPQDNNLQFFATSRLKAEITDSCRIRLPCCCGWTTLIVIFMLAFKTFKSLILFHIICSCSYCKKA